MSSENRSRRKSVSCSSAEEESHRKSKKEHPEERRDRARRDSSKERGSRRRHRSRSRSQSRSNYRKQNRRDRSRSSGDANRRDRKDYKNGSPRFVGTKDYYSKNRGHRRRDDKDKDFDHANAKWGKGDQKKDKKKDTENKAKPDFALSGKLTEETNTFRGVVVKYSEPPEARKPKRRWRLYPFKGEKALQTLYIHRESAYLIGRDRKVVDLPIDHPSCSKQHAALQYRLVPFTREDGSSGKRVRPYIIDLESANGTFINNQRIEAKKYVELLERDVIKFGFSSREYVLLHENSKDEALDDDVKAEEVEVKEEKE